MFVNIKFNTMNKIQIILIAAILISLSGLSQNEPAKPSTLWLINGKKLTIYNHKFIENGNFLAFENLKKKTKEVERTFIFSIIDSKGVEKIYFTPDTLDQRYYSVENMRSFCNGDDVDK